MTFERIAEMLGFSKYPPKMATFYNAEDMTPACDLTLIDELQREFEMFGEYYDTVRMCAEQCNADPMRSAWVKTATAFAQNVSFQEAKSIPVLQEDGTQLTAMLPLYILIPQLANAMAEYRRRGFSEDEIHSLFSVVRGAINSAKARTGMPGINALFYGWVMHFAKVQMLNAGGLQFELREMTCRAVYLKHRQSGTVLPVLCDGTHHRSGVQMIGSAGYDDADGAFTCTFSEDATHFYGHEVVNGVVASVKGAYAKEEWTCLLRPGDECIGMHIPGRADISAEAIDRAIAEARKLIKERFSEFRGECIYCGSWLLDPTLGKLLGEDANITRFQRRYVCIPELSNGMHVFGNVFPARFESFETLPEDTRLQRLLKQLYLDGGYIYSYSGIMI